MAYSRPSVAISLDIAVSALGRARLYAIGSFCGQAAAVPAQWRISLIMASARSALRRRCGRTLPWPAALDLQLQGQVEKRPNDDDERQNEDVLQCRSDAHRADDVAGDQELETQQDRTPEVLAVGSIAISATDLETRCQPHTRYQGAEDNREDADIIEDAAGNFRQLTVSQPMDRAPSMTSSVPVT
jgi:hypothetical protein